MVLALLLAFVNNITKERIEKVNAAALQQGLFAVMENADHFIPMDGVELGNSYGVKVDEMYLAMDANEDVIGYCAVAKPGGYAGEIETIVGVDLSFKITGVNVTSNMSETPGLGAKATDSSKFTYQFADRQWQETSPFAVTKDGGDVDAITSATITSRAVTNGVNAAIEVMNNNSIYGSSIAEGEIVDGKYIVPAKEREPEEGENAVEGEVREDE